jgi:hypothetical protein
MNLEPDPARARALLEEALKDCWSDKVHKIDLIVAASQALGLLKGYSLPKDVLDAYVCTHCGAAGVKLWRSVGYADEAWCCACAAAQAGLPDTADAAGRWISDYGDAAGRSDQIYNPAQGQNLLPWVPAPDGGTWGYTSVPPEGCHWWRALPTRKVQMGDDK